MKTQLIAVGTLFAALVAAPSFADELESLKKAEAKAAYSQALKRAEAEWTSAKAACAVQAGTPKDKDDCVTTANRTYQAAKADAKAARKIAGSEAQADEEMREAQYDAEKVRCGALTGDAKDACIAEAKSKFGQ